MFSLKKLRQENTALQDEVAALRQELKVLSDEVKKLPVLVAIHRKGSVNDFTFVIKGKEIVISTYSTNFDQVQEWKKDLNLT